jgi:hypothetical protein
MIGKCCAERACDFTGILNGSAGEVGNNQFDVIQLAVLQCSLVGRLLLPGLAVRFERARHASAACLNQSKFLEHFNAGADRAVCGREAAIDRRMMKHAHNFFRRRAVIQSAADMAFDFVRAIQSRDHGERNEAARFERQILA